MSQKSHFTVWYSDQNRKQKQQKVFFILLFYSFPPQGQRHNNSPCANVQKIVREVDFFYTLAYCQGVYSFCHIRSSIHSFVLYAVWQFLRQSFSLNLCFH